MLLLLRNFVSWNSMELICRRWPLHEGFNCSKAIGFANSPILKAVSIWFMDLKIGNKINNKENKNGRYSTKLNNESAYRTE